MSRTTSYRAWTLLRNRPIGSTVQKGTLRNQLKGSDNALYSVLAKMVDKGGLKRVKDGVFEITQEFIDWGENRSWHMIKKASRRPAAKKVATVTRGDNVLDKLLAVMAEAEPEIRRLRELDKKLKELVE